MNVMEVSEEVLRDRLRRERPEFQKLEQEHRSLDDKLMAYELHVYLTPEEEFERRRLQKLKLATKDKIMEMIRHYRVGQA